MDEQHSVEHDFSGSLENPRFSLNTTINLCSEALDEVARLVLNALTVLPPNPNTFSKEAALNVSGVTVDVLEALTGSGLLETSEPGRYSLHQATADYVGQKHPNEAISERFVTLFINFVMAHAGDPNALDMEVKNILAALLSAHRTGLLTPSSQGSKALLPFLEARGLATLIV